MKTLRGFFLLLKSTYIFTTSTNRDDDSFMDCMNDYDLVGTVTTVSSDARNLQSYYSNSLVDDENDIESPRNN